MQRVLEGKKKKNPKNCALSPGSLWTSLSSALDHRESRVHVEHEQVRQLGPLQPTSVVKGETRVFKTPISNAEHYTN